MDQRREHDPELDREWDAAVEAAHRRLSRAEGPFDCAPHGKLNMIRRGKRGRLQLVAAGEGRWSAAVEERFKMVLRDSGNVRAAAHSVGFSESAVWQRRRQWPAFAQMLEETLEEAELALEFRIAAMASNVVAREGDENGQDRPSPARTFHQSEIDGASKSAPPRPSPASGRGGEAASFDLDAAMRFLKWREEKRRGRGRRTPVSKAPSIEDVTEKIVRRVEAIKRHRRRGAE